MIEREFIIIQKEFVKMDKNKQNSNAQNNQQNKNNQNNAQNKKKNNESF